MRKDTIAQIVCRWLTTLALFCAAPVLLMPAASEADGDTVQAPNCLEWQKSAPYRGYGYNHIVSLTNNCDTSLLCRVSTSATPTAVRVDLDAGDSRQVTTRVGSPAREFSVRITCGSDS